MWESTKKIAYALWDGLEESGIKVTIRDLKNNHISDIITDVLSSKMILIGTPTLNNTMLPTMGKFLTYLKGLKPKNRIGFVFGSFGWGGQAVGEVQKILGEIPWETPIENININYIPDDKELLKTKEIGTKLAQYLK